MKNFNNKFSNAVKFFSPVIRKEKVFKNVANRSFNPEGFTLVELIVVVMMIGILSSIAIPQFMSAADKAKQKEASAVVASMVKAATAYNTEYGALPANMGEMAEYARFQQCADDGTVEADGGSACKDITPTKVEDAQTDFYTTSGHYRIYLTRTNDNSVLKIRAVPNGGAFKENGSGVTGCYNPGDGVSQVKEMTAQSSGRGYNNVPDWTEIECGEVGDA